MIDLYDPEHPKDRFSAPMAEIAENLHRRELGEIERAELMARWVEITAAKQEADAREAAAKAEVNDKPAQLGQISRSGGRGKKGGVSQAARDLGVTRQTIERSVKIAALAPEAKRLAKRLKAPQAVLLEAAKHEVADDQASQRLSPNDLLNAGNDQPVFSLTKSSRSDMAFSISSTCSSNAPLRSERT